MKHVFKFSVLSVLLLVLGACKRDKAEYLGPGYISAPAGFAVTSFTATPSLVNFTTDSVMFNATFSHAVSWTLTLVGQTSGATFQRKGVSNSLVNFPWGGTHDGIFFFRKGENVTATLSFFGTNLTSTATVQIATPRNFKVYGQFPITGDFEQREFIEPSYGPPVVYSPYWAHFNFPTPIPNVVQGLDSAAIDRLGNVVPSVEGKLYYYIKGKGNQQVFVSGIQYTGMLLPALPATPDNIWINMYVYGTGDKNAGIELEYQEEDADGSSTGYQGSDDDAFVARILLDHVGWKLVSYKYSDLTPSLNAPFGGSGNHIHEPHRLRSFDMVLLKKVNPDEPVEVYIDFPIITVGGPFNPSK
jgi:hypothetical protein